jgi:hypothetical protein
MARTTRRDQHIHQADRGRTKRRFVATTSAGLMLLGTAAFAAAELGAGDVAIAEATATDPADVTRAGTPQDFSVILDINAGNIQGDKCDGQNNKITYNTTYTLTSTGLVGSGTASDVVPCSTTSKTEYKDAGAVQLIFELTVTADTSAALGASGPLPITFGTSGTHFVLGDQVTLVTSGNPADRWSDPSIHVNVRPRPASGLTATAPSSEADTSIDVSWTRSADHADITSYVVTRNGTALEALVPSGEGGTTQGFTDIGLTTDTEYCYTVLARFTADGVDHDSAVEPVAPAVVCLTTGTADAGSAGYTIEGFYQPVDNAVVNGAKAGRVIPLKFNILDDEAQKQDDPALVETFVQRTACSGIGAEVSLLEDGTLAAGKTELRWDPGAEQMVFNWKTAKTPGCYRITLTVDGDSVSADFHLS